MYLCMYATCSAAAYRRRRRRLVFSGAAPPARECLPPTTAPPGEQMSPAGDACPHTVLRAVARFRQHCSNTRQFLSGADHVQYAFAPRFVHRSDIIRNDGSDNIIYRYRNKFMNYIVSIDLQSILAFRFIINSFNCQKSPDRVLL